MSQIAPRRVSVLTSKERRTYATREPSGEISGSLAHSRAKTSIGANGGFASAARATDPAANGVVISMQTNANRFVRMSNSELLTRVRQEKFVRRDSLTIAVDLE
jgi:hypothetical protein